MHRVRSARRPGACDFAELLQGRACTSEVEARNRLIADQENLLNTYLCLFCVDTGVVPGGCPNPDQVSPGIVPQNPTQQDIVVQDGLIQSQEALVVRVALDAIKPRANEGEFFCHLVDLGRDVVEFRALVMAPRPARHAGVALLELLVIFGCEAGKKFEHPRMDLERVPIHYSADHLDTQHPLPGFGQLPGPVSRLLLNFLLLPSSHLTSNPSKASFERAKSGLHISRFPGMGFEADSRPAVSSPFHRAFNHRNLSFTGGPGKVGGKREIMREYNHLALLRELGKAIGNTFAPDVVQR